MQFQKGTVRLVNGSAQVDAIWEFFYSVTDGTPYVLDETMIHKQGGTSVGSFKFVREDTTAKAVYAYRQSGTTVPVPGDTLEAGGSGADRTIERLGSASPPDYDDVSDGIAIGDKFLAAGQGAIFDVAAVTNPQRFLLSANWSGDTQNEVEYAVVRDFTAFFSWPYPQIGDIDTVRLVADALVKADNDLKLAWFMLQNKGSGTAFSIDWTAGHQADITPTGTATVTFSKAPKGPGCVSLIIRQGGTAFAVTLTGVKWPANVDPLDATNQKVNSVTLVRVYYDGTNYYGSAPDFDVRG